MFTPVVLCDLSRSLNASCTLCWRFLLGYLADVGDEIFDLRILQSVSILRHIVFALRRDLDEFLVGFFLYLRRSEIARPGCELLNGLSLYPPSHEELHDALPCHRSSMA